MAGSGDTETSAVVLLSGGLDSATTLAVAREQGFACHALSFRYGQRHAVELAAAKRVARALGVVEHRIVDLGPAVFGGSALTDPTVAVPKDREHIGDGPIPPTYVPARNTLFLAYALAWAEVLGTGDLFIGVTAADYSGYPDCRPAYIEAFERMANLAVAAAVEGRISVRIHAPLIAMTKADIIRTGTRLGVDYGLTHSCYDPDERGRPCGRCDSCRLRLKGFAEAGLTDPVDYPEQHP